MKYIKYFFWWINFQRSHYVRLCKHSDKFIESNHGEGWLNNYDEWQKERGLIKAEYQSAKRLMWKFYNK